jgi:hypothetical protein
MDTPWGPLHKLDDHDLELASSIIATDKDTLVEGLIVENTFDQILKPLAASTAHPLTILDIETVITAHNKQRYAFVWVRTSQAGLGRYLQLLEKVMPVFWVELIEGEFFATPMLSGQRVKEQRRPLTDVAHHISGRKPKVRDVDLSVRDASRLMGAFWGFLSSVYRTDLWKKVVLPRLFINHGLAPYFGQVWNLDRICLYQDRLWLLEIKHKYPFGKWKLQFGINEGELENIKLLYGAGINCLHVLLIKPIWEKGASAMYLYNQRALQQRVAAIAIDLGKNASRVMSKPPKIAPRHTSVSGSTEVKYFTINADQFGYAGSLANFDIDLAKNLLSVMDGHPIGQVADDKLRSMKIP